jgi:protein-L-isoaspartate(D-aspartate) O-methyltransferase
MHLFCGDGYLGLPQYAPFDGILITAAAPEIPQTLVDQLKVGGVLVIPLGDVSVQTMYRMVKKKDESLEKEKFGGFRFVPLLRDVAND